MFPVENDEENEDSCSCCQSYNLEEMIFQEEAMNEPVSQVSDVEEPSFKNETFESWLTQVQSTASIPLPIKLVGQDVIAKAEHKKEEEAIDSDG